MYVKKERSPIFKHIAIKKPYNSQEFLLFLPVSRKVQYFPCALGMKETDWNVHCFFWLQNNRRVKKIRFASYSTTRDYYYENILFQFSIFLEGNVFTSMYTDVSIYKYTYVHAYAHTHTNTHKSLHT